MHSHPTMSTPQSTIDSERDALDFKELVRYVAMQDLGTLPPQILMILTGIIMRRNLIDEDVTFSEYYRHVVLEHVQQCLRSRHASSKRRDETLPAQHQVNSGPAFNHSPPEDPKLSVEPSSFLPYAPWVGGFVPPCNTELREMSQPGTPIVPPTPTKVKDSHHDLHSENANVVLEHGGDQQWLYKEPRNVHFPDELPSYGSNIAIGSNLPDQSWPYPHSNPVSNIVLGAEEANAVDCQAQDDTMPRRGWRIRAMERARREREHFLRDAAHLDETSRMASVIVPLVRETEVEPLCGIRAYEPKLPRAKMVNEGDIVSIPTEETAVADAGRFVSKISECPPPPTPTPIRSSSPVVPRPPFKASTPPLTPNSSTSGELPLAPGGVIILPEHLSRAPPPKPASRSPANDSEDDSEIIIPILTSRPTQRSSSGRLQFDLVGAQLEALERRRMQWLMAKGRNDVGVMAAGAGQVGKVLGSFYSQPMTMTMDGGPLRS
ncbi:hypothetical protein BOTBODRAFT_62549 [Botryobasidium botryosum FD-172 SS1]|uniref:Uncharacterized protein n=1 Tax=Botryobasidium botryosum (strain FD-172 SS1) TaxID=930990 RepID=A0A067N8X2_BOTB1|nr:hypothetical protein BOTBODRAFT_62549 [Botryobasidium botryosum FD-172 SS1]